MHMKLIVAADKNWGIGYQNRLLVSLADDMKRFKRLTERDVVIYGRKTLDSFPGGRPLPGRDNLILSHDRSLRVPGAVVCRNLNELGEKLQRLPDLPHWVIGGESVYRQLMPYCRKAYVTQVDQAFKADAFFPDLNQEQGWDLVHEEPWQTAINRLSPEKETVRFRYLHYQQLLSISPIHLSQ